MNHVTIRQAGRTGERTSPLRAVLARAAWQVHTAIGEAVCDLGEYAMRRRSR